MTFEQEQSIRLGKAEEKTANLEAILNKIVPYGVQHGIFEVKDGDIKLLDPALAEEKKGK